jgi:hypothetical protein
MVDEMRFNMHSGRNLLFIVLSVFVIACGTTPAQKGSSTSSAQNVDLELNHTEAATVNQVQLRVAIHCGPWLVLAPHAATYTQSELAAMKTFVTGRIPVPGSIESFDTAAQTGYSDAALAKLPPTLQYVPGDPTCSGYYEVTNTGRSLVQVNSVGFQLSQPGAAFQYDYHILDACSFMHSCVCEGCGAQFTCSYTSTIQMALSHQAAFAGTVTAGSQPGSECPLPINLQPGQTVPIIVVFTKPPHSGNLWFRGTPTLSITSTHGTSTLTYATLLNNVNLINLTDHPSHGMVTASDGLVTGGNDNIFPGTCYSLKGNHFQPITSFAPALDASKIPSVYSAVCV